MPKRIRDGHTRFATRLRKRSGPLEVGIEKFRSGHDQVAGSRHVTMASLGGNPAGDLSRKRAPSGQVEPGCLPDLLFMISII